MKNARTILASAGLLLAVALLAGCNGRVEAFTVQAVGADGRTTPINVEDLARRSPEDEARIAATPETEPIVFRVPADSEGLTSARALVVHLAGDLSGGELRVGTVNSVESARFEFDALFSGVSAPAYALRLVLPAAIDAAGMELHFRSASSDGFVIEQIDIEEAPPAPVVELGGPAGATPVLDSRVPTALRAGRVEMANITAFGGNWSAGDALEITYDLADDGSLFADRGSRPRGRIELTSAAGDRRAIELRIRPGRRVVTVRPWIWGIDAASIAITSDVPGFAISRISGSAIPADPLDAVSVELTELQTYPSSLWRRDDFEVFEWSIYPEIVWIDSIDYATQARFFRRLAFFVEKRGFMGRLLTDEELATRHGWNAHNYRPEGLADFFNAVRRESFPINAYERELLRIVLHRGILVEDENGTFLPGVGGILAISQESWTELRSLLTVHEAMHGVFYQEPDFRRASFDYWENELSARERAYWQDFLAWMTYSPDDTYLMVNEFQGYLLQQSEAAVRWYFRSRIADRLRAGQPQRRNEIDLFLREHPETFVRSGAAMNAALFRIAGMVGGDPWCLVALEE